MYYSWHYQIETVLSFFISPASLVEKKSTHQVSLFLFSCPMTFSYYVYFRVSFMYKLAVPGIRQDGKSAFLTH